MTNVELLILALLLDAALGEPDWLWSRVPHPAVVMGAAIDRLDRLLNRGGMRILKGAIALGLLVVLAWAIGSAIAAIPDFGLLEIVAAAILLAHRSLVEHVEAVARALRSGLADARIAVSKIVGRETRDLDETGVSRGAIESLAENFSDGVVAPAFWFALLGLPGILVYKLVNTADSMIGHRTPEYEEFGKAAAKLDDAMNWLPARLTGLILVAVGMRNGAFSQMVEDAETHRSPNAGWPEGAVAATLGIALSGPRRYGTTMTRDPFVNPHGRRTLTASDIGAAIRLIWQGWRACLGILVLMALIYRMIWTG